MNTHPYTAGMQIEHTLVPGFRMTVLDIGPCDTEHCDALKVVDPDGVEDWLCSNDVHPVDPTVTPNTERSSSYGWTA